MHTWGVFASVSPYISGYTLVQHNSVVFEYIQFWCAIAGSRSTAANHRPHRSSPTYNSSRPRVKWWDIRVRTSCDGVVDRLGRVTGTGCLDASYSNLARQRLFSLQREVWLLGGLLRNRTLIFNGIVMFLAPLSF